MFSSRLFLLVVLPLVTLSLSLSLSPFVSVSVSAQAKTDAILAFRAVVDTTALNPNAEPDKVIERLIVDVGYTASVNEQQKSPPTIKNSKTNTYDVEVGFSGDIIPLQVVGAEGRSVKAISAIKAANLFWASLNGYLDSANLLKFSGVDSAHVAGISHIGIDNSSMSIVEVTNVNVAAEQQQQQPNGNTESSSSTSANKLLPIVVPIGGGVAILVMVIMCVIIKRRRDAIQVLRGTQLHSEGGVTMA